MTRTSASLPAGASTAGRLSLTDDAGFRGFYPVYLDYPCSGMRRAAHPFRGRGSGRPVAPALCNQVGLDRTCLPVSEQGRTPVFDSRQAQSNRFKPVQVGIPFSKGGGLWQVHPAWGGWKISGRYARLWGGMYGMFSRF